MPFFGFSEKFINWLKLINNDIKIYVLQTGYLSEYVDPLLPYLYNLGAKNMALLFIINPEIIDHYTEHLIQLRYMETSLV